MSRNEIIEGVSYDVKAFTVALDAGRPEPLYEQLAQHIIGEIRAGRLVEGEKLPGVRALCGHLSLSRSTVEAAYAVLDAEGYVQARERSGRYVMAYEGAYVSVGRGLVLAAPAATLREGGGGKTPPYKYAFSTAQVDTSAFPYRAWAKLYKGVVQNGSALLLRGHAQGDLELREALAVFLSAYRGVRTSAVHLVIGAGVDHLLGRLMVLLGPEAVFALEDPGYPAMRRTLADGGRGCVPVPLDGAGMDVAALAASRANVACVTPSHQFPTGITMPAGRRARLTAWAAQAENRYIVEDDYDSEFRHTTRPIPAMQGMDPERVVYIGTFNRSLAPSIRVAYMALPAALLMRHRERYEGAACAVSRFEQQTLAQFLSTGQYLRHLRRMAGIYRRRRDALVEAFSGIEGVRLSGDEAGLHCLLTHQRLTEAELVRRARDAGVHVHGLSEYGRAGAGGALVLGYGGMDEAEIRAAAEALGEAWRG